MTDTRKAPTLNCPQCGDPVRWSEEFPHRPFCSKRCKLMDFGDWANENHKIPGDPVLDPADPEWQEDDY